MVNLSEFMQQGSLFSSIEVYQPLPFLGDGQNLVMDRLLTLQYGDKQVYDKLYELSLQQIAEMITILHGDDWNDYIMLATVNKTASKTRTTTENITSSENRNNNRDDKNVVSAYNDDELIVNDGVLSNTIDDTTGNKNIVMTDETIELKKAYDNLSLSKKNNIMNIVLSDVSNFMTLSIY